MIKWSDKEFAYLKKYHKKNTSSKLSIMINDKFHNGKRGRSPKAVLTKMQNNQLSNKGAPADYKTRILSTKQKKEIDKYIDSGWLKHQIIKEISKSGFPHTVVKMYLRTLPTERFLAPARHIAKRYSIFQLEKWFTARANGASIEDILYNIPETGITSRAIDSAIRHYKRARVKFGKDIQNGVNAQRIKNAYAMTTAEYDYFVTIFSDGNNSIFKQTKDFTKKDGDRILDAMENNSDVLKDLDLKEDEVNITISTDLDYIAIVMSSDWHLGSMHTNVGQLRKDVTLMSQTEGLYVGFLGDSYDGFICGGPHLGGINEAVIPVRAQRMAAIRLFEELQENNKVLFATNSCHNNWAKVIADYDSQEDFCRKLKIPYLGHGADVNLKFVDKKTKLPGKTWKIHAGHKFGRGSGSKTNPFLLNQRYLTQEDKTPDVVAFGHYHINASGIFNIYKKPVAFLRCGIFLNKQILYRTI